MKPSETANGTPSVRGTDFFSPVAKSKDSIASEPRVADVLINGRSFAREE
jgi:hypothetical protein